jgi:hypothetical protein
VLEVRAAQLRRKEIALHYGWMSRPCALLLTPELTRARCGIQNLRDNRGFYATGRDFIRYGGSNPIGHVGGRRRRPTGQVERVARFVGNNFNPSQRVRGIRLLDPNGVVITCVVR